jgi:nicotinamide mononucleotide transporter
MNVLDWVALLTGVAGVLLTIAETVWCWPVALVSVVISGFAFWDQRLFGDMSLQVFYFFSGIYGWIYWKQKQKAPFTVSHTPLRLVPLLLLCTALLAVVIYYLLDFFKGDKILFDAILTAMSLTTTYMMARKWIENWLVWIVVDGAYVILYLQKDLPLYAVLYAAFVLMVIYGYFLWLRQLRKTSVA